MADSYVCSGATMRCTMGTSQARLTVLPTRTVFLTGKPQANISDHLSFVNLGAFGRCRSLGYPATASATAAAHGHLTPMPCAHNTPFPWMGGKNDYIIKGDPALLKSSTCQCMWGGTISITDDGQTPSDPVDLSRCAPDVIAQKEVPYCRKMYSSYNPLFSVSQEQIGENAIRAERDFRKLMEESATSYNKASNWLSSPVPKEESQGEEDTKAHTIANNELPIGDSESEILLKGHVSYNEGLPSNDEFSIKESEHSTSIFREWADLSLSIFDYVPLIRNTKATITITIDALIAGLSIGISVGVDKDLRRYLQLNLNSWIGGDYSDLVDFNDIRENKKYKKKIEKLAKKYGKRLCVVKISPSYETGVSQPVYDWLEIGGIYVDLDFQLDKLLEINVGMENLTNISDMANNAYAKISGTLNLPNLELKYGWDSKKIDTNAGFYIEITPQTKHTLIEDGGICVETPLKDDDRPIGLSQIKEEPDPWSKSIYQENKFDTKAVAKVGSSFTYTWQLENLLEKRKSSQMIRNEEVPNLNDYRAAKDQEKNERSILRDKNGLILLEGGNQDQQVLQHAVGENNYATNEVTIIKKGDVVVDSVDPYKKVTPITHSQRTGTSTSYGTGNQGNSSGRQPENQGNSELAEIKRKKARGEKLTEIEQFKLDRYINNS